MIREFGLLCLLTASGAQAQLVSPAVPPRSDPNPIVQPVPTTSEPIDFSAPSVVISNDSVRATVYLPGGHEAFYHGTRFDQMGVIGSLVVAGHDFYRPWWNRTSAAVQNYLETPDGTVIAGPDTAISGPAEEFDNNEALGYEPAAVGGTFLKIGVGILRRASDAPYNRFWHYDIVDGGNRTVTHTARSVTLSQEVRDPASGYGYRYIKTYRLPPRGAEMVLEHRLRNIGNKQIVTRFNNHNYMQVAPANAHVVVTMPFPATALRGSPNTEVFEVSGRSARFLRPLVGAERQKLIFTGYGKDPKDYDFTIADAETGAAVHIVGDQPIAPGGVVLLAQRTVMTLEPNIEFTIAPGQSVAWSYTYTYTAPHR
jgi:hypothetical protein